MQAEDLRRTENTGRKGRSLTDREARGVRNSAIKTSDDRRNDHLGQLLRDAPSVLLMEHKKK